MFLVVDEDVIDASTLTRWSGVREELIGFWWLPNYGKTMVMHSSRIVDPFRITTGTCNELLLILGRGRPNFLFLPFWKYFFFFLKITSTLNCFDEGENKEWIYVFVGSEYFQ